MEIELEPSWQAALAHEINPEYFATLQAKLTHAYQHSTVFPPYDQIYSAFSYCPLSEVTVVILGQDPYHNPGQAHGLAFSVSHDSHIPPSLINIFKEMQTDVGAPPPKNGNLIRWAKQGVLLLNTTLTVEQHKPGSHQHIGWGQFTDAVIQKISNHRAHVAFLLWGRHAHTKEALIDTSKHLVLSAPHPSPLSAHRGFFGCRHFSQTNTYLTQHNLSPIDW